MFITLKCYTQLDISNIIYFRFWIYYIMIQVRGPWSNGDQISFVKTRNVAKWGTRDSSLMQMDVYLITYYNPCVMIICLFSNLIETFKIMDALNKRSGFQGITGVPDSRDVEKRFEEGDQKSQLAIDMFCYRWLEICCFSYLKSKLEGFCRIFWRII